MTRSPMQENLAALLDLLGEEAAAQAPREKKPAFPRILPWPGKLSAGDLLYEEFCRRRTRGEPVDPDVFCKKFPLLGSSFIRVVKLHAMMEEELSEQVVLPAPIEPPQEEPPKEVAWPGVDEDFLGFQLNIALGSGTFARVFLASESKVGSRYVVVKIAQKGGGLEAEILGRIHHPNIVPIHSIQEDPVRNLTVVCMPFLGTETLTKVLDRIDFPVAKGASAQVLLQAVRNTDNFLDELVPPQPEQPFLKIATYPDSVRWLGMQLADALAHIHERGICHLDLKPSNVLMSPAGVPLLLDFNLARAPKVWNDQVGGTLLYMPPEQLLASDGNGRTDLSLLDARSDIYALGVILHQVLTGEHPFQLSPSIMMGSLAEQRLHLLECQLQGGLDIHAAYPWVDKPFARLIERCLAFQPEERPQTAAEVSAILRQGLTPLSRTRRWLGRHPRAVAAVTFIGIALSSLGFGGWLAQPPFSQRQVAVSQEQYRRGQYKEAVQHYTLALEAEPTLTTALFGRGRAYQQLGATDKKFYPLAMADFLAAEKLGPDGKNLLCTADCLAQLDNYRAAIGYYELAMKQSDYASAEAFNNLGYCYLKLCRLEDAQTSLDRAIRLNQRLSVAFYNRACIALRRAQEDPDLLTPRREVAGSFAGPIQQQAPENNSLILQSGIADIQRALKLGPATADLHYKAACLYSVAANLDAALQKPALEHLQEAVKMGKDSQQLRSDRFFTPLCNLSEFDALAKNTRAIIPLEPTSPMVASFKE